MHPIQRRLDRLDMRGFIRAAPRRCIGSSPVQQQQPNTAAAASTVEGHIPLAELLPVRRPALPPPPSPEVLASRQKRLVTSQFPARAVLLEDAAKFSAASTVTSATAASLERRMARMLLLVRNPETLDLANPFAWSSVTYADVEAAIADEEAERAASLGRQASVSEPNATDDEEGKVSDVLGGEATGSSSILQELMKVTNAQARKSAGGGPQGSHAAADSLVGELSGGAAHTAHSGGAAASSAFTPDLSPPITGGLTPRAGSVLPAASPLALLWLEAAVAHLEAVVARLKRHAADDAAAPAAAPATGGADAARVAQVLSALTSIPVAPLAPALQTWMAALPRERLDALMAQLKQKRRGLALGGSSSSSVADSRVHKLEGVIAVLRGALAGKSLSRSAAQTGSSSSSSSSGVGVTTVRQLYDALRRAVGTGVPSFTPVSSAAAASAGRFRSALQAEQSRLDDAVKQGRATRAAVMAASGVEPTLAVPLAGFDVVIPSVVDLLRGDGGTLSSPVDDFRGGFDAEVSVTHRATGETLRIPLVRSSDADAAVGGASADDVSGAAASASSRRASSSSASPVLQRLNDGHVLTALSPLARLLTPTEAVALQTLVVLSSPLMRESLSPPLPVSGVRGGGLGGAASAASEGAHPDSLAAFVDHVATHRTARRMIAAEAEASADTEAAFTSLATAVNTSSASGGDGAAAGDSRVSREHIAALKAQLDFSIEALSGYSGGGGVGQDGSGAIVAMLRTALSSLPEAVRGKLFKGDPLKTWLDRAGLSHKDLAEGALAAEARSGGVSSDGDGVLGSGGFSLSDPYALPAPLDSSAGVLAEQQQQAGASATGVMGGTHPGAASAGGLAPLGSAPVPVQYYPRLSGGTVSRLPQDMSGFNGSGDESAPSSLSPSGASSGPSTSLYEEEALGVTRPEHVISSLLCSLAAQEAAGDIEGDVKTQRLEALREEVAAVAAAAAAGTPIASSSRQQAGAATTTGGGTGTASSSRVSLTGGSGSSRSSGLSVAANHGTGRVGVRSSSLLTRALEHAAQRIAAAASTITSSSSNSVAPDGSSIALLSRPDDMTTAAADDTASSGGSSGSLIIPEIGPQRLPRHRRIRALYTENAVLARMDAAAAARRPVSELEEEDAPWDSKVYEAGPNYREDGAYGVLHERLLEAGEARDLEAMLALWFEHVKMAPQEGAPDFLAFEIMMDACASAGRGDLVQSYFWKEANRLRMVCTPSMLFILLKSAGMAGDVDTAESLLSVASSEGHAVGIHHYSAAISASIKAKEWTRAYRLFNTMRHKGIAASPDLFMTIFRGLHRAGRAEDCHYVWQTLSRTPRIRLASEMYTELISMFAEQGNLDNMQFVRDRMSQQSEKGLHPQPEALLVMLQAYTAAGIVPLAQEVVADLKKDATFVSDTPEGAALRATVDRQIAVLTRKDKPAAVPASKAGGSKQHQQQQKQGQKSSDDDGTAQLLSLFGGEGSQPPPPPQQQQHSRKPLRSSGGLLGPRSSGGSGSGGGAAAWTAGDAFDADELARFGLDEHGQPTGPTSKKR